MYIQISRFEILDIDDHLFPGMLVIEDERVEICLMHKPNFIVRPKPQQRTDDDKRDLLINTGVDHIFTLNYNASIQLFKIICSYFAYEETKRIGFES
jgi:hypothetical protein